MPCYIYALEFPGIDGMIVPAANVKLQYADVVSFVKKEGILDLEK